MTQMQGTIEAIAEYDYHKRPVDKGYTDRTLSINLSESSIEEKPVDKQMKHLFIGGKGFDLWLLWNALPSDRVIAWDDPTNEVCIASGPLGGTINYPGAGKSIATAISPLTGSVIDSNVGGFFGPYLKFAGFDALEIQGKAQTEVVVFIDGEDGKVIIEDGSGLPDEAYPLIEHLHEAYGAGNPRSISVVCAGPGAEKTLFGCLNFSWYDLTRKLVRMKQAGRGGIGTVFRDKRLKALVVRSPRVGLAANAPADLERLKAVGKAAIKEVKTLDPVQNRMTVLGTTGGVAALNEFDLLPIQNYRSGSDTRTKNITGEVFGQRFDTGFDGCWMGCAFSCSHGVNDFVPSTGRDKGKKVFVDGPEYETIAAVGSNCGIFDPDHIIEMNYYCDNYAVDTISVGTAIAFVMECYELGLITQEHTGGLECTFGNTTAALTLLHQMAKGEGFGALVGQGIRKMKQHFATHFGADRDILQDIGMEAKGLEYSEFVTKEAPTQAAGYGLALKGPQHDEMSVAFADAVSNVWPDLSDKVEALYWLPLWRTWFGLCGLCKLPWSTVVPEDNKETAEPWKVMGHVESYAEFFSAVTGRQTSPEGLLLMSERVYNFQRIFALRMGYGRREHDEVPYRSLGPVLEEEYDSRAERYDQQLENIGGIELGAKTTGEKLKILRDIRTTRYNNLRAAVYKRRGWNTDGVPTIEKVNALGIGFNDVLELIAPYQ